MYIDTDSGRSELQTFVDSIITKKLMDNLNRVLNQHNISNTQISAGFSNSSAALNKIINQAENLKTGTLLKIIRIVNNTIRGKDNLITLDSLITEEIKANIDIANKVPFERASILIHDNVSIFKSFKVYSVLFSKRTEQFKKDFYELTK